MLRKLLACVGKYKKETILTPITVIIEVILEVAIPFLMALIIDIGLNEEASSYSTRFFNRINVSASSGTNFILIIGLIMVGMAIVSLLFGVMSGRFAAVASQGFAKNIRKKLFSKVQSFSFYNIDRFNTSSLITRLTTDVTNVQNAFMMTIRVMVRAPVMLTLAIIMSFNINSSLAWIFIIIVPLLILSLSLIGRIVLPLFHRMLKRYDKMNSKVQENLIGIRVVKAYVREEHEINEFKKASNDVRQAQIKAEKLLIFVMPFMQMAMYACLVLVAWYGGNLIISDNMTTGQFMSFLAYIGQILMSLVMITMVLVMIVMSRSSALRIGEVLNEVPDINDSTSDDNLVVGYGSIEFNDVNFSYANDVHTLENINLSIKSGENIGIIGGTGSSKTTLVQLIPRLYDASHGTVKVDGRDVKDYKIKNLRDSVAMVLQKNVLFSGTIRDNLLWGKEDASEQEIIKAAKAAQAHDFIMSFPNGYDTILGQGGVNVSGGQKQRLTIARALLKNPKIMILDDSTSAVDTTTESSIRQTFKKDFKDITLIIIAQRVSSIKDCDRIIVLDNGKINGIGAHEELIKNNDIYREVYQSQARGRE